MKAFFGMAVAFLFLTSDLSAQEATYRSDAFVITDTSVVQGSYEAVAVSPRRIVSSYPSEGKVLLFKFSINGKDNERPSGQDHRLTLKLNADEVVTPVYEYGAPDPDEAPEVVTSPDPDGTVDVTFRVDMRPVLRSLETQGTYTPPYGAPIDTSDFAKGLYIAGGEPPLSWDFASLPERDTFRLSDPDGDGIYETTIRFEDKAPRAVDEEGRTVWTLSEDVAHLPQYTSSQRLVDALYNLSLEEMLLDIRDDGAFMAGAKWTGVWTRDISYSILLGLALVDPEASRRSLMAKVAGGRIIQDTGTGGSWPVSTDRMTWALAAWEVYAVTGDEAWLRTAYEIIKKSAEADLETARSPETGLFYGESSFLDWREQSYPRWMDPKDIYRSQNLGTNVVHYATYRILGRMAEALGEPAEPYHEVAETIRDGINTYLWNADRGYYGQYLYGRNFLSLSPRAEALGEALTVLFDVATPEQQERIVENTPVVPFGVSSFYPHIPDIPPYHNDGIWPFVVAYWTWAAAKAGNAAAVEHGLASIYRAAALFLTNKENMVAATGDYKGTAINSDRQLWSVAGNLATVYRIFFGMQFHPDRLVFEPFVPEPYGGTRTLTNVRYRDAVLTVTMHGYGDEIEHVTLDGEPVESAEIPADMTGPHTLVITMNNQTRQGSINLVQNRFAPDTPTASSSGDTLRWTSVEGAVAYEVYRNGARIARTSSTSLALPVHTGLTEYQVRALGPQGYASFLSEPVRIVPDDADLTIQPVGELEAEYSGYTGPGYLTLSRTSNTTVTFTVEIPETGPYSVDVRYANGSGPINTDNRCAVRSLFVDGTRTGSVVMPQRGDEAWTNWGYSNPIHVYLPRGIHTFTLSFTPADENMHGAVNRALLDHLRLARLDGMLSPYGHRPAGDDDHSVNVDGD